VVLASFLDATKMSCVSPKLAAGSLVVEISNNGADFTADGATFMVEAAAEVFKLQPAFGPTSGGSTVNIHGANFVHGSTVCRWGDATVSSRAVHVSDSHVRCLSEAAPSGGVNQYLYVSNNNGSDFTSVAVPFQYHFDVQITSVYPLSGVGTGGTFVTVTGSNFMDSDGLACKFSDVAGVPAIVPALMISSTQVKCRTPRNPPGSYTIQIANNGIDFSSDGVVFVCLATPAISVVQPNNGTNAGGTLVTIHGKDFSPDNARCRFGTRLVSAVFMSSHELKCFSPQHASGSVPVEISNNADFTSSGLTFTFHAPAARTPSDSGSASVAVISVHPPRCESEGGVEISVRGQNFTNSAIAVCRFGDIAVPAVWHSSTEVRCIAPRHAPSTIYLEISMDGKDFSYSGFSFEFYVGAAVTKLVPSNGPITGNTLVTVYGNNFARSDSLVCRFGSTHVPITSFLSSTAVTCLCPPSDGHSKSLVVEISNNNFTFSDNRARFVYDLPATISALSPSSGSSSGGTEVLVLGHNFIDTPSLACKFDGTVVAARYLSASQLLCDSPPHSPAGVAVEVTLNRMDYTHSGTVFQFHDRPTVTSIWPVAGPAFAGRSAITVFGSGFIKTVDLSCRFGHMTLPATWINGNKIACRSPKSSVGLVGVSVTNNGHDFSSGRSQFLFQQDASVYRLTPSRGLHTGQYSVFVSGSNFVNSTALGCRFGNLAVRAIFISRRLVTCIAPSRVAGSIEVVISVPTEVTNNGLDYTNSGVLFEYLPSCIKGSYCSNLGIMACPNGTSCSDPHQFNFTRCEPGTFQPRTGQRACLICPVGFYCPDFGLTKPLLCPAGRVCDAQGLRTPVKPCRAGHYCLPGTKTTHPTDFFDEMVPAAPTSVPNISANVSQQFEMQEVTAYFSPNVSSFTLSFCRFETQVPGTVRATRGSFSLHTNIDLQNDISRGDFLRVGGHIVRVHTSNGTFDEGAIPLDAAFPGFTSRGLLVYKCSYTTSSPIAFNATAVALQHTLEMTSNETVVVSRKDITSHWTVDVNESASVGVRFTNGSIQYNLGHIVSAVSGGVDAQLRLYANRSGVDYRNATFVEQTELLRVLSNLTRNSTALDVKNIHVFTTAIGVSTHNSSTLLSNVSLPALNVSMHRIEPRSALLGYNWTVEFGSTVEDVPLLQAKSVSVFVREINRGRILSPIARLARSEWRTDNETGVVTFRPEVRSWSFIKRQLPATGQVRHEHPPHGHTCEHGRCTDGALDLVAEQPFPCPLGTYCKTGVASPVSIPKNFSTPQRCFDGFFCPRGTVSPEGQGPCPTGYFCPTQTEAYICPRGQYCPGVGNIKPLDCYPGTYNPDFGRSNCTLCPTGHICSGWRRTAPEICPAGFVCIALGLSAPALLCPPGYFCKEGTLTLNPSDTTPLRPKPCAAGTFCLAGVAHNLTIDWIPTRADGSTAPQTCTEGAYCGVASSSPSGSGACFPGHYCPPGSSYPTQAAIGSFASKNGSVVSTLCFPGTYAPLKSTVTCRVCPAGYQCRGYGTYEPSICPAGTYRSLADSVTCRMCPGGTWSSIPGIPDISYCEPCPAGRVCGIQQMIDLKQSVACPAGHVCGEATPRNMQFAHQCPGGFYCDVETPPDMQYNYTCPPGYFCKRGTKFNQRTRNKCPVNYYCPQGTSTGDSPEVRCPAGTTTAAGADSVFDCEIKSVHVCDKKSSVSYYPEFEYTTFKGVDRSFDSASELIGTGEIPVLRKIIPVNVTASSPMWVNDTVEVFRSCPENGTRYGGDELTIIGRNFRDTPLLLCRFRARLTDFTVTMPAIWESTTRVRCKTPPYGFDEAVEQSVGKGLSQIDVSNNGLTYSASRSNYTYLADWLWSKDAAVRRRSKDSCMAVRYNYSLSETKIRYVKTTPVAYEEGIRAREQGWFMVKGLNLAKVMFDFRHLPAEMRYDEHYKIAAYVHNSSCTEIVCDENRQRLKNGGHMDPCTQPLKLPYWLLDPAVDKHNKINITFMALEDTLIKFEVHLMYGIFLPTVPFFLNSTTVRISGPSRANITHGQIPDTRPLSRVVSYEEKLVPQQYMFTALYSKESYEDISAPLNLPPHYKELERGRILASFNTTDDDMPWTTEPLLGNNGVQKGPEWWAPPASEDSVSQGIIEEYREVFHEFNDDSFSFDKVVLPYLPFFSSCQGYDSYIPIYDLLEDSTQCSLPDIVNMNHAAGDSDKDKHWWRRKYPAFPHQDDIKVVRPQDILETPIADWCERSIKCKYEEDLSGQDVTARWFEATSGAELFSILHEPQTLDDFFRGGVLMSEIEEELTADVFVPVTVDRDAADDYMGGCTRMCFPRSVSLELSYYQYNTHKKRLLTADLIFEDFDEDTSASDYELSVAFMALDWIDLIIAFAFEREVFLILFVVIGLMTVSVAILFWIVNRLTTSLQTPPRFRFFSFLGLIAPPPMVGVTLACVPVSIVMGAFYLLLNGDRHMELTHDGVVQDFWLTDRFVPHYMENKLDPDTAEINRIGRVGLCFLVLATYLIFMGAHIFLPQRVSKREKEIAKKRDAGAAKEAVWVPTLWKRSNMVFSSFMMGAYLVVLVEFSFWEDFGTYIWQIIIVLKLVAVFVEMAIDRQLKEHLLICPLVSALTLIEGLVTLGADDFKDFLLSYFVEFGIMMVERVYVDPGTKAITEAFRKMLATFFRFLREKFKIKRRTQLEIEVFVIEEGGAEARKKREVEDIGNTSETVEPILDSFTGYANETLALFFTPFIISILIVFRTELFLPEIYGIKEQHMEFYLMFALVILPFQLTSDIFIHNVQELFHGWKVYDYLVYTRYRFLQRETRWKGLEDSLDECIEEGMRTIDQMCFSSQFYFMSTLHTSGIILLVLAIEIMLRSEYNMFGDPTMLALVPYVYSCCYCIRRTCMYLAWRFKFWKIKHENTAWHSTPDDEDDGVPRWDELEKIKGASHEAYLMNQRINSETFRYKFLNYNRAWLVNQLPHILTPRTLRRSRPYLITQFTKILGSVNPDISSDSESDEDPDKPKFGPVALSAPSRNIIRMWLAQARRRRRLREIVQPIINQARRAECEQCLSRRQLQVELLIPIEVLGDKFEKESMTEEFDQVAWKEFFKKHAKFRTLCLDCMLMRKEEERKMAAGMAGIDISDSDDDETSAEKFGPVFLSAASRAIMIMWYRKAQDRVFGRGGRARPLIPVSDDEEEDIQTSWANKPLKLSAASKALAVKWLTLARTRIIARGGPRSAKTDDPYRVKREKRKPGSKGISGKKSQMRRK
jgi:hypothetical protein